jgi:SP family arabinose:H+ symporter-like MFS transporter
VDAPTDKQQSTRAKTIVTSPQFDRSAVRRLCLVYLIAMIAAVGGFLFGYDMAIISGAMIFLKAQFALTPGQLGFATGSALLGCMVGPIVGGKLSDQFGRKRTLILSGLLFAMGAIGTSLPRNIIEFNLFRFIGGMGVGLASVVSPMYIAEISPAHIRGRLVTINQLAIVTGLLCSVMVSYWLSFGGHWRWMFASNSLPVPLFIAGLLLVPESPRWLVQENRLDEAMNVLTSIEGRPNAEIEMKAIHDTTQEGATLKELLHPGIRRALFIACALAIFQQITGVSILMMYMPYIFQKAGFPGASDAIFQNVILSVWNVFCTLAALLVVDRLGRRPLLLWGTAGMAMGLALMGAFFHCQAGGIYVVLTMFLSVGAYVVSLAPLGWLIMSEIFPNRLRGQAMGVATVCLWAASFLTANYFPPMVAWCESRYGTPAVAFWIYSGICALAFLFSLFSVPETKGRTLEEIGASWTKGSS